MDAEAIFKAYVRYIGAGAVATGGIISLCRAMPLIVSSIRSGLARHAQLDRRRQGRAVRRTDRDLPLRAVFSARWRWSRCIWIFLDIDPQTSGESSLAAMFNVHRLESIWPPRC